jgi:hypothetical protein
MLLLQDSLEPCLVPRVIEELLDTKLVAPPPSAKDIPSPLAMEGEGVQGCPVIVCPSSPLTVRAELAALGVGLAPLLAGPASCDRSQRVQ